MRYDFGRREFIGRSGSPFTEADFQALAQSRGASAAQAGATTLKRSVFIDTLVQGAGREGWGQILGELARQSGAKRLDPAIEDLFYSQPTPESEAAEQARLWGEFSRATPATKAGRAGC